MKKLFLILPILLSACSFTKDVARYELVPSTGNIPAVCLAHIDIVEIIKSGELQNVEGLDGTCPYNTQIETPEKTQVICSKEPQKVPLEYCGIYPTGSDIRGFKKIDDMTVCYSKTFKTILPLHYCLPNTDVNVHTSVSSYNYTKFTSF